MIVVADAGPLIHLSAIGQLDLVRRRSDSVLVPTAVFDEVVVHGAGLAGANEVREATWISVVAPSNNNLVNALLAGGLHNGEAEAIALAEERRADLLLIDELQGRLTAERMGLSVIGTLGILVAAKERGEIPAIAPMLQALQASGLWLSKVLVRRVLEACREGDSKVPR